MDQLKLIIWTIAVLVVFKIYLKFKYRWCKSYVCLAGKTAVVTGANTGIGYYTALDFAKRGARVILACRNREKAESAKEKIIAETNNKNIAVKLVDMESLDSVRQFTKNFNETEDRLDLLVNNAGGVSFGNRFTKDGLQVTLQVNHFSHFLLTHLLLDKLKASAPSRIINVASAAAKFSKMTIDDINRYPRHILPEQVVYAHSKLCNILFTLGLADKLKGTGVTSHALHPGCVVTEFARRWPSIILAGFNVVGFLFFKTSEEGAQTTVHAAIANELEDVTGGLFEDCRQIKLYNSANNPTLVQQVWDKSEELVGLKK